MNNMNNYKSTFTLVHHKEERIEEMPICLYVLAVHSGHVFISAAFQVMYQKEEVSRGQM